MPELPEVETIKKQLTKVLPFKIKKEVRSKVLSPGILKTKSFTLKDKTILSIKRHGKLMIIKLSNDEFILSHLGMSGSWRISETKIKEKHTHLLLEGTNNKNKPYYLGYVDPRRFGFLHFINKAGVDEYIKKHLGPDVSSKEFHSEYLNSLFKRFPDKMIKPFLLEQKHMAGIGNYMASEICARAFIHPEKKLRYLNLNSAKKLIKANQSLLKETIKNKGTTFSGGYSDANGEKGDGVKNLVVFYQKVCGLCKITDVKKIELKGRGTYFCPSCQKRKNK